MTTIDCEDDIKVKRFCDDRIKAYSVLCKVMYVEAILNYLGLELAVYSARLHYLARDSSELPKICFKAKGIQPSFKKPEGHCQTTPQALSFVPYNQIVERIQTGHNGEK